MTRPAHCPVCDDPTGGARRCGCGYDLDTGDASAVLVRLAHDRQRAARLVRRGLGTLVLTALPAMLLAARPGAEQIEIVMIVVAQLVLGASWVARGVIEEGLARRRLRAASSIGQLPAARVVGSRRLLQPGPSR